jgi:hypothetical protein
MTMVGALADNPLLRGRSNWDPIGVQPQTISIQPLLLRPVLPTDTDAIFRACQDPSIAQWTAKVPFDYT